MKMILCQGGLPGKHGPSSPNPFSPGSSSLGPSLPSPCNCVVGRPRKHSDTHQHVHMCSQVVHNHCQTMSSARLAQMNSTHVEINMQFNVTAYLHNLRKGKYKYQNVDKLGIMCTRT